MPLDSATTSLLEQLAQAGTPPLAELGVDSARALLGGLKDLYGRGPEVARRQDVTVDGTFPMRLFVPDGEVSGVVVYYHGGGWVLGDIDEFDTLARTLATRTGCAVLLPAYRLAPEHPFPAAVDDAWSALRWAAEHRSDLGVQQDAPLVVAGDSAGGTLATVVARRARDEGGPAVALQVLAYPVTDSDLDRDSYLDPVNQLLIDRSAMGWFWSLYCPDAGARRDPAVAPLHADDLAGLPRAVVLTAEHDVLRDEGEAYVEALREAGVSVAHRRFTGQMHGFFTMTGVLPGAAEAMDYVAAEIERRLRPPEPDAEFDAVVVGAGFAGLYALHRLRGLGLRVRVYEAGGGVGGTWYWNRYPGARCDVESVHYSYSFSPELDQEWDWTERFASQPEILSYLEHVADRFDLRRDIVLDTRVEAAHFDEACSGEGGDRWLVRTDTGEVITARFVVMATGVLSTPKKIDIPGIDDFGGERYHTGHWPHEGVDFTGKRVAVIGTGSSAVQSIPQLAQQAEHLTVFQRTPTYCMPAMNRPLHDDEKAAVKAGYPEKREAAKYSPFGMPGGVGAQLTLEVPPAEREETYERNFTTGSTVALLSSYADLFFNLEANETVAGFVRRKLREQVKDPETADALTPTQYPFGAKRPCLDTDYWVTYNRDNVSLVDLGKTPIQAVTATGIRTSDAEHVVDAIVFATGFDALTGALEAIDIRGRGGRSIAEKWRDGAETLFGVAVAGFPNLFAVAGPGSPSVLSNMIVSIEQHVDWLADAIEHVRATGSTTIEAAPAAEQAWTDHVAEIAAPSIYPMADSWYMGANVPGKPRRFLVYIGGVNTFRQACDESASKGYEGFVVA